LTSGPETSFGAYGLMLNMMFIFLLASITVLTAVFAYAKHSAKKPQEMEWGAEVEREFMKAEKEREKVRKTEETGYSERDEKEGYQDDESDDDGE
jgi:hypothetical protein